MAKDGSSGNQEQTTSFNNKFNSSARHLLIEQFKLEREGLRASRSADLEAKKAALKLKISAIKDLRKQQVASKVADKMQRINLNRTDHWKLMLEKLAALLKKIEAKRDELKTSGNDTAELDKAIDTANLKLDIAAAAVASQSGKIYTFNVSSVSALRQNIGTAISGEQKDLRQILFLVNDAKKSVHDALNILKRLFGSSLPKIATQSGSQGTESGSKL